jgi:tyrosyl-tRNA synthetase
VEDALQILSERGFIQQCTDREGLQKLVREQSVTFYNGFDPTAESLHVGHLLPIMAMAHLQRAGHRPLALVGGGTALVGDPSGKTEMRQLLSPEEIARNLRGIREQFGRYLDLGEGGARLVDNAEWLMDLRYIDFLRDIGRYFRVNEMIRAEAYRMRLEREEGLSFIEFNYQLLQAYDFLVLFRREGCLLQTGGDDQWSNILAGADLIRRVEAKTAYGLTYPLLTTARGEKMGKTAAGAVWLAAERTSPYEYYQYWINCDDRDVRRFLALFTFLPIEEVARLGAREGADLREAKEALAFEATKLTHGAGEAEKARAASRAAFGRGGEAEELAAVPTSSLSAQRLAEGIPVVDLFCEAGLTPGRNAARRLIQQGGAYVNGRAVTDTEKRVGAEAVKEGAIMLRSGKKRYHRVLIEGG